MNKIIAAVKSEEQLSAALSSAVKEIFLLTPTIENVKETATRVHESGKLLYVHMDMAAGIGKDAYGVRFVKQCGADGVISTRTNIIKFAKDENLLTVQRFFIIDAQSVSTAQQTAAKTSPDMIELMPGCLTKATEKLKDEVICPIIAGGLIETEEEIRAVFAAGASAVSTSKSELWGLGL